MCKMFNALIYLKLLFRMQVENIDEKVSSPPPSKLSSPTTEALETAILKVFLNSGSCVIVKFAVDTLVKVN